MKSPVVAITGRYAWGRDGSCWSCTRVPGFPYLPGQQDHALESLSAAFAGLRSEFALWGLCEPIADMELEQTIAAFWVSGRIQPDGLNPFTALVGLAAHCAGACGWGSGRRDRTPARLHVRIPIVEIGDLP